MISFFLQSSSYAILGAAKDVSNSDETTDEPKAPKKLSYFNKAIRTINRAKKLEQKNKIKKANLKYKKALEYLHKSNTEKPAEVNTYNYLGFVNQKLGNFAEAEIYYILGLELNPNHIDINKNIINLYISMNKIDSAKERLKVLKNCNCNEFFELNNVVKSR